MIISIGQSLQFEIFVVDNGSSDATIQMLTEDFPQVNLIKNESNFGYTKAMNMGLKLCQGNYLVQLNPDVIIYPDTFQKIVAFLDQNKDVGICTPKVINSDGTLQKQCHRSFARPWDVISYFLGLDRLFPKSKFFGRYLFTYLPEDQIADVQAVSGSCMVIRDSVIQEIGYLDEQFFAYQEDTDFCFRANKANWRVVYFPQSIVKHFGGKGGSLEQPYKAISAWHKSYFLYYKKHLAKDYFFLVNWFMYIAMGIKLFLGYLRLMIKSEKVIGSKKP
jgi:GT2 family glycosyltransferase